MYRTCKCGGIIRENMKPYWDTLPSCSCQNPIRVETPSQTYKAAQAEFKVRWNIPGVWGS